MASKEQIKRIYGLGAGLGLVGKDRDDMLHEVVCSVTGKTSIKELNDDDFRAVQSELIHRMRFGSPDHPKHKQPAKKQHAENPGMATSEQQRLCWRLCYQLADLAPSDADVGDRLVGAINKTLGVTANKKDPFRWVNQEQCSKLIEYLKRFVNSAKRKKRGDKLAGS